MAGGVRGFRAVGFVKLPPSHGLGGGGLGVLGRERQGPAIGLERAGEGGGGKVGTLDFFGLSP
jgi:hypothetical protein